MSIQALALDGWDQLSTWGYDDGLASFYAQLTRNGGNDDDGPEIWLTPHKTGPIYSVEELAVIIGAATGSPEDVVVRAMGL